MRLHTAMMALLATAALLVMRPAMAEDAEPAGDNPAAEGEKNGPQPGRPPLTPEMKAKLLAEFDLDGDGELNEEEETAMHAALAKRRAERKPAVPAEFDTNGDGTLSDEEKAAMNETLAQRRAERRAAEAAKKQAAREAKIAKFDENGDGKLTGEELENARAAGKGRKEGGGEGPRPEGRGPNGGRVGGGSGLSDEAKARMLQQFDADGNGKLEGAELEKARQAAGQFKMQQRQGGFRGGPAGAFGPGGPGLQGKGEFRGGGAGFGGRLKAGGGGGAGPPGSGAGPPSGGGGSRGGGPRR